MSVSLDMEVQKEIRQLYLFEQLNVGQIAGKLDVPVAQVHEVLYGVPYENLADANANPRRLV